MYKKYVMHARSRAKLVVFPYLTFSFLDVLVTVASFDLKVTNDAQAKRYLHFGSIISFNGIFVSEPSDSLIICNSVN